MVISIVRLEHGLNETRGVLLLDGVLECVTLELPWRENGVGVSCIPAGMYGYGERGCSPGISASRGRCLEIVDVVGRSDILIHVGNTHWDIEGCVLVGQRYGKLSGDLAVLGSKEAFIGLMSKVERAGVLQIVDVSL